jgi:hypothetical protein
MLKPLTDNPSTKTTSSVELEPSKHHAKDDHFASGSPEWQVKWFLLDAALKGALM